MIIDCLKVLAFVTLIALAGNSYGEALKGKVIKIADGDTLTIVTVDDNPKQHKIRLAEIDTPERGQPYYKQSKQALSELVYNTIVSIEVTTTDRYGRRIGMIFDQDQRWINAVMVRSGHAWVYNRYVQNEILYAYQDQARLERLGIWSLLEVQALEPWKFRQQKRNNQ